MLPHQTRCGQTLGYARLYGGVRAADDYRAMISVGLNLQLEENASAAPLSVGVLVSMVDSLQSGTLNDVQRCTLSALGAGLLHLAQQTALEG